MDINFSIGQIVKIKRTNGRIHTAVVSGINKLESNITVEWTECEENKGKQLTFVDILEWNPELRKANFAENPKQVDKKSKKSRLTYSNEHHNAAFVFNGIERMSNMPRKTTIGSSTSESAPLANGHQIPVSSTTKGETPWNMIRQYRITKEYRSLIDGKPNLCNNQPISVYIRKNSLSNEEIARNEYDVISIPQRDTLIVHELKTKLDSTHYLANYKFRFDRVFHDIYENTMVYKHTAQPLIETIFDGGMATCFDYGSTDAGKIIKTGDSTQNYRNSICALAAKDIFSGLNDPGYKALHLEISVSSFEIYDAEVFDLLANKKKLRIKEDNNRKVHVVGLTEKVIDNVKEALQLMQQSSNARATAKSELEKNKERKQSSVPTSLNDSLSHAVFQFVLRRKGSLKVHGKFSFIDLANDIYSADIPYTSFIPYVSGNKQPDVKAAEINKSLLPFVKCIHGMGKTLAQVLRESFVREKSKICMIAMISAGLGSTAKTLETLRFADRIKQFTVLSDNPDISYFDSKEEDIMMNNNKIEEPNRNKRKKSQSGCNKPHRILDLPDYVDFEQFVEAYESIRLERPNSVPTLDISHPKSIVEVYKRICSTLEDKRRNDEMSINKSEQLNRNGSSEKRDDQLNVQIPDKINNNIQALMQSTRIDECDMPDNQLNARISDKVDELNNSKIEEPNQNVHTKLKSTHIIESDEADEQLNVQIPDKMNSNRSEQLNQNEQTKPKSTHISERNEPNEQPIAQILECSNMSDFETLADIFARSHSGASVVHRTENIEMNNRKTIHLNQNGRDEQLNFQIPDKTNNNKCEQPSQNKETQLQSTRINEPDKPDEQLDLPVDSDFLERWYRYRQDEERSAKLPFNELEIDELNKIETEELNQNEQTKVKSHIIESNETDEQLNVQIPDKINNNRSEQPTQNKQTKPKPIHITVRDKPDEQPNIQIIHCPDVTYFAGASVLDQRDHDKMNTSNISEFSKADDQLNVQIPDNRNNNKCEQPTEINGHDKPDEQLNVQIADNIILEQNANVAIDPNNALNVFLSKCLIECHRLCNLSNSFGYDRVAYYENGKTVLTRIIQLATECRELIEDSANE